MTARLGHPSITLLENGTEFFPALLRAIELAQRSVELETYIFAHDRIGQKIFDAMRAAVQRGVQIRVIMDWLGTGRRECEQWQQAFQKSQMALQCFNPFFSHGLARTHRKIAIVDDALAFVGGINIKDDLNAGAGNPPLPAPRWDFAVALNGPIVRSILLSFESQWRRASPLEKGRAQWQYLKETMRQKVSAQLSGRKKENPAWSYLTRDNFKRRNAIQRAYVEAIQQARDSILLVTPYFAPGRRFRISLMAAARRGVRVKLLIGVGEIKFQDRVTRSFYPLLMKSGVEIIEYRKTLLHAKVAVIDAYWTTLGSSNCDGLSLFINQEANVVIKDAIFAQTLSARIGIALQESTQIALRDYLEHSLIRRTLYRGAYIIYRTLMRIVTRGEYQ